MRRRHFLCCLLLYLGAVQLIVACGGGGGWCFFCDWFKSSKSSSNEDVKSNSSMIYPSYRNGYNTEPGYEFQKLDNDPGVLARMKISQLVNDIRLLQRKRLRDKFSKGKEDNLANIDRVTTRLPPTTTTSHEEIDVKSQSIEKTEYVASVAEENVVATTTTAPTVLPTDKSSPLPGNICVQPIENDFNETATNIQNTKQTCFPTPNSVEKSSTEIPEKADLARGNINIGYKPSATEMQELE